MSLTGNQIAALREMRRIWPDVKAVVIGATALGFYFDMSWRKTADVDLVVALTLDELPDLVARAGWHRHPTREHEFIAPGDTKIDLLPAGSAHLAAGRLQWRNGQSMSLAGMDLALQHAELHLAEGHGVLVAPPQVVTLLKMVSFDDRPAERERDLEDIGHVLDAYVGDVSERRWEEGAEAGEFDLAPAYLVGIDIARLLVSAQHRAIITGFLRRVQDPDSPTHALMRRLGPRRWSTEDDALTRRLAAFTAGLERYPSG